MHILYVISFTLLFLYVISLHCFETEAQNSKFIEISFQILLDKCKIRLEM